MAEFSHTVDAPSSYEVVLSKQNGTGDALLSLNDRLSKVGLKAEIPESPQAQIQRIREENFRSLIKQGVNTPLENIQVWRVQNDVFAVQVTKSSITSFQKGNGEIIMNPWEEAKSPFIKNYKNPEINDGKGITEAGYIEKKEDGVWNLYELIGTDQKGESILGKKLNPKSPEYFKAWQDIVFYSDTLNVLFSIKNNMDIPETGIENLVRGGSMKIETLELLLKKWNITQEVFQFGVWEMRKILVSQCQDSRFDGFNAETELQNDPELMRLWTRIKESDLKRYYDTKLPNGERYIDEKLVAQCFAVLPVNLRDVSGGKK